MATAEITIPMARALYPNYAKLKDNLEELTSAFLVVLRTVGIISFSFGFGIAAVADDVVHVVLGSQWGFAVPLIEWLGIFGTFAAIQSTVAGHILIVLHRERTVFVINWLRLVVFGSSLLIAASVGTVGKHRNDSRTVDGNRHRGVPFVPSESAARIRNADLVGFFRLLLTAGTFAVVKALHSNVIESHFLTLMLDVATGATFFSLVLYLSWIAAGRPNGAEQRMVGLVSNTIKSLRVARG